MVRAAGADMPAGKAQLPDDAARTQPEARHCYMRIGGASGANSLIVSSDSMTHKPYIPRAVPKGMLSRCSAETTIVRIRAHGAIWSNPTPARTEGIDDNEKNDDDDASDYADQRNGKIGVRITVRGCLYQAHGPAENRQDDQGGDKTEGAPDNVQDSQDLDVLSQGIPPSHQSLPAGLPVRSGKDALRNHDAVTHLYYAQQQLFASVFKPGRHPVSHGWPIGYSGDYEVGPPRRGGQLRAPAERAHSPQLCSHRSLMPYASDKFLLEYSSLRTYLVQSHGPAIGGCSQGPIGCNGNAGIEANTGIFGESGRCASRVRFPDFGRRGARRQLLRAVRRGTAKGRPGSHRTCGWLAC